MALAKLQVKIGGLACSFCVETIRKGLGRIDGVAEVHVSLAHDEASITDDPMRVTPAVPTAADPPRLRARRAPGPTVGAA